MDGAFGPVAFVFSKAFATEPLSRANMMSHGPLRPTGERCKKTARWHQNIKGNKATTKHEAA